MPKRKPYCQQKFRKEWLTDSQLKEWLTEKKKQRKVKLSLAVNSAIVYFLQNCVTWKTTLRQKT